MKILIFSVLLGIVFLAGCSQQPTSQTQPRTPEKHVYLKHFGDNESNIFVECKKDSDCKLVPLGIACTGFGSINIDNNNIEIEKYINEEQKLMIGVNFQCATPVPTIENSRPICKNDRCEFDPITIPSDSDSERTCINEPGNAFYPPNEKCCNGLKSIFGEDHDPTLCKLNEGLLGAPICAPCGNGKCEKEYGENRCSCPEDCK